MGEKNTKFFHACATERQSKNKISTMKDTQGITVSKWQEIKSMFNNYFKNLFQTTSPSFATIEQCLNAVKRKVTLIMNKELQQPFTGEEVQEALMQMAPLKSPRPDGIQ